MCPLLPNKVAELLVDPVSSSVAVLDAKSSSSSYAQPCTWKDATCGARISGLETSRTATGLPDAILRALRHMKVGSTMILPLPALMCTSSMVTLCTGQCVCRVMAIIAAFTRR